FLDQLMESIGVVLNVIAQNMRTEELLSQSQGLTEALQERQEELQTQQEKLQQTNEELEEKAQLLAEQNARIEVKNREVELARAALEDKAEQLALSSRYKSEFLANMSHELRTPLNSLLILAKLLSENAEANLNEKQIEYARTIHAAGSDLLGLINDILDLSKVEAGKMDVHPAEVQLAEVREFAERTFRPLAEEKRLEFSVEVIGANVPPTIVIDEQRLQQVLKNLLSNAIKFTEKGSVKLQVRVAPEDAQFAGEMLSAAETVLAFTVSDTGIGIPEDQLRLIFEAFQQADGTTSRRYGGTGLGLSISREIARLLGGEIHAQSEVGKGSSFTLYVPSVYHAPARRALLVTEPAAPENGRDELDPSLLLPSEVRDDRDATGPGDRV